MRKGLKAVALSAILLANCGPAKVPAAKADPPPPASSVAGVVSSIDEDSFPFRSLHPSYFAMGVAAQFQYEVLTISRHPGDRGFRLLVPRPTAYQVNDEVRFTYRPAKAIPFRELVQAHGVLEGGHHALYPLQQGRVEGIDGIVK